MRSLVLLIAAAFALAFPPGAMAQDKKWLPPKIEKLEVGFHVHRDNLNNLALEQNAFKAGLWTPVYIEIFGGTDGVKPEPKRPRPYISIETTDSDDVGTRIQVPVDVDPMQSRRFIGYVKAGHVGLSSQDITVQLHDRNQDYRSRLTTTSTLGIDAHLYLTLGSRLVDFQRAFVTKEDENNLQSMLRNMRLAVFETDVERLPTAWFGYDSVDLMILATDSRKFLTNLNNDPERLRALAQWVRRGGRLVVPIARQNQDAVSALLQNKLAWQPAIPVVPPSVAADFQVERLVAAETWSRVGGAVPFIFQDRKDAARKLPIRLATLDPGNVHAGDWKIEAVAGKENRPVIAQVRYGLGQITYFAFSFEDRPFFEWTAKTEFLKALAKKLAPWSIGDQQPQFGFGNQGFSNDLATDMIAQLDNFDVKVIPFGYVALFIVLYILVVGPLDFFLLKYVFKRLEWTWITFPSVVLAVSVIAYFAAYALKGRDMKINKIDIVDFDLRTSLDDKRMPKDVHAYGHSFFTILSPRIQNYTIGVEPNVAFWGKKPVKQLNVDLLSWLGRPSGGMNNMGRGGSSGGGFFRRPYDFADDATGLRGVPIPVWTTKAFTGDWEEPLAKPPFVVDLTHHAKKADLVISGKLENHLGADLVDAWLLYNKKCYPLRDTLKSVKLGAVPQPISIFERDTIDVSAWTRQSGNDNVPDLRFNPTSTVRQILFHEQADPNGKGRNHLLRRLDLGWRVRDEQAGKHSTHEAILVARVKMAADSAQAIAQSKSSPVPTKLWLTRLPEAGAQAEDPPELSGLMSQCTTIRVILPLKPADE